MTMNCNDSKILTLGYDFDKWHGYGNKTPISTDISPETNSHIIISGMSGSAKTSCENTLFAKLVIAEQSLQC